ncbi:hypothetical protein, partial [Escherichia coli]
YCLKTQPATGETYPKSDLFNKALNSYKSLIKMYEYEKLYDIRCHRKIITMGYTLLKNSSVD